MIIDNRWRENRKCVNKRIKCPKCVMCLFLPSSRIQTQGLLFDQVLPATIPIYSLLYGYHSSLAFPSFCWISFVSNLGSIHRFLSMEHQLSGLFM